MTWPALALLATLALQSSACGPDKSRDEGETLVTTTQPATMTDAGTTSSTSTSAGTGSSGAPTTTGSGMSDTAATGETTTMGSSSSSSGDVTTQDGSSSGGGSSSSGDTGGVKLDLPVMEEMPIPVHDIPGLESITFYETTGKVTEYTFLVAGPELSNLLADPLTLDNRDIQGTSVEFYDVYYSDEDGTFNADGSYLTIAGSFGAKLPAGGGLNLAEISLNSAIIA